LAIAVGVRLVRVVDQRTVVRRVKKAVTVTVSRARSVNGYFSVEDGSLKDAVAVGVADGLAVDVGEGGAGDGEGRDARREGGDGDAGEDAGAGVLVGRSAEVNSGGVEGAVGVRDRIGGVVDVRMAIGGCSSRGGWRRW